MKKNKKIILFVLLLVSGFVFVKGGVLARLCKGIPYISYKQDSDQRGNEEILATKGDGDMGNEAPGDEGAGNEKEDIRYVTLPIDNNVRDKDSYYDYSNSKLGWWIKRGENHEPSGCDDTLDIREYGAYYLGDCAVGEKVIYLTFDCGYENEYTNQILDVLKNQEVPACFFVTQTYIRDNIELTKRMKEEGHQVGNHTITHPSMPTKSYEEIIEELTGCADYMKEVTGYQMDPYLRPPMGEYSERTLKLTSDLGYKTIFWSMAYMDYDVNNQPGTEYVINHFEKYHHNGAIVLMHNVSSSNADALETVIVNLKQKGYRFASLNELK